MIRIVCVILLGLSAAAGPAVGAPKFVTIQEGTGLKVSMPSSADRMAFDLLGRIWVAKTADGIGRAVTDDSNVSTRPAFSPDGRFIACETLHDGLLHIEVMNSDGSDRRRVTFGDFDHRTPSWSPDGERLLFSSNRGGDYSIWELNVATLALAQLTFASRDEWDPAWNAQGTKIAYIGGNASQSTLFSLHPGQKPVALLTEDNALYAPAWRPDDLVLTYVRPGSGGGALRMLILSNPPITKSMSSSENVFPHPVHWIDGNTVLYSADGHIKRSEFGSRYSLDVPFLATVPVESTGPRRAERPAGALPGPNLNIQTYGIIGRSQRADGSSVVSALGDLWEINADGSLSRQLTNDAFVDSHPVLSGEGKSLAFISDRLGDPARWVMDLDSGEIRRAQANAVDQDGDEHLRGVASSDSQAIEPLPLSWLPAANKGRVIIRAGRIFDGIAPAYLARREIVIDDNLITDIRPWPKDDADTEPGAVYIDAHEHTVIPGLIDLGSRQATSNREAAGREWLSAGVTSIRENIIEPKRAIEQRESWRSGRRAGPRMHYSMNFCDAPVFDVLADADSPMPPYLTNLALLQTCAGDDASAIRKRVAVAHALGIAVTTPEPYPGLLLGIDEVSLSPQSFGPGGVRRKLTAAVYNDVIDVVAELQIGIVSNLSRHAAGKRRREVQQQLFRITGRGGRVATGSGAPDHGGRGTGLHDELQRLVDIGLQPFQVLKMATLEAARLLGRDDEIGSIEAGKLADLVIVTGDPLRNIGDAREPARVMLDGRAFSAEDLSRPGLRGWSVEKLYN